MFDNLKALRDSLGLKQEEFGAALGVKKSTYSNYETGRTDPPASFWVDVANRYAVTTDYLLGLSDDPHGTAHGGKTALEANYDTLDAHGRRLVDLVVDAELERMAAVPVVVEVAGGLKRHRITPHSCRHTFATLMKRAAGADKDKQALIGHASAEMLRYYQDVDLSDLRAITDAI